MNDSNVERLEKIPYFDKDTTDYVKGIALIMMFIHHVFMFPGWWVKGISYPILNMLAPYLCTPFKMCVPVFCFLTGYFYFFNQSKTLSYSWRKITDVMINYWVVWIVFSAVAIFLGYQYSFKTYVLEMFVLETPVMNFCWYVHFYYAFMLLFPCVIKFLGKSNFLLDCIICLIVVPLFCRLFLIVSPSYIRVIIGSLCGWFPVVLIGYVVAKYDLYRWGENHINRLLSHKYLASVIAVLISIIVCMFRKYVPCLIISINELPILKKTPRFYISLDALYAFLFIFCIIYLYRQFKIIYVGNIIRAIGKQSLLMWFVSCIFFNVSKVSCQWILYYPHNLALVFCWGLFICYVMALFFDYIAKYLIKKKNQLLFDK